MTSHLSPSYAVLSLTCYVGTQLGKWGVRSGRRAQATWHTFAVIGVYRCYGNLTL